MVESDGNVSPKVRTRHGSQALVPRVCEAVPAFTYQDASDVGHQSHAGLGAGARAHRGSLSRGFLVWLGLDLGRPLEPSLSSAGSCSA